VAGSFYPGQSDRLASEVDRLLREAPAPTESAVFPKALIVPHAGYAYSGPVAATAYAQIGPARERIRRVAIFGPSHFISFQGLALPGAAWVETPLGRVEIDAALTDAARKLAAVSISAGAHAKEHSLEVQLPFLQLLLGHFRVALLAVGRAKPEEVASAIEALWGEQDTLLVISSDLSHYLPYQQALEMDRSTARRIAQLGPDLLSRTDACGAEPINGLLRVARRRKLRPRLLDLRNSGDTAGGMDRVVGYGSFAFYEQ
jgi:AmmeMemoRadiSam system protein B